jgi:hypothetical protein
MDTQKIDSLLGDLKKITLFTTEVGGRVEQVDIEKAEKELGITFSEDFKKFLSYYGNIDVANTLICGLDPNALEDSRRGGENVVVQSQIFREYNDVDLRNRTVLINREEEWYILLDHLDNQVYSYDPFSGQFEVRYSSLEEAIVDVLARILDSYK